MLENEILSVHNWSLYMKTLYILLLLAKSIYHKELLWYTQFTPTKRKPHDVTSINLDKIILHYYH